MSNVFYHKPETFTASQTTQTQFTNNYWQQTPYATYANNNVSLDQTYTWQSSSLSMYPGMIGNPTLNANCPVPSSVYYNSDMQWNMVRVIL